MATYYARKTGNINAADVWATTPSGIAAAVTFASGDVLVANSFTVTVNVSTDLGSTGELRNDNINSATAGGSFTLADGVTLTANIVAGSTGTPCVNQAGTASGTIVGNSRGGTSSSGGNGITKASSGILSIIGNITGGSIGVQNGLLIQAGIVNLTGNITGGSGASGGATNTAGVVISGGSLNILSGTATGGTANGVSGLYVSGGTVNFTGNSVGSSTAALTTSHGITNAGTGTVTLNGNATGGNQASGGGGLGIVNSSTGTVVVNGNAIGGSVLAGASNSSTGTMTVKRVIGNAYGPGNTTGLSPAVGASNPGLGVLEVQEIEFGTYGQSPVSGTGIRLKKANTNVAVFNYCDTAGAKTLIDATANAAMPAATDVRSGVSYASGALTGSCAVPAAGSTALGVPVDAGFGTAVLTPEAVWGAGTRTITGGTVDTLTNAPASVTPSDIWDYSTRTITGGTVTTLTNAPSVPTPSQIASQVRSELSVELGRVDQAISTRATPANIPTNDITAIKAKTDAINVDRINNTATLSQVGNLLAQANS